MVPILPGTKNMLNKRSAADAFQVRSVSKERFIQKIGVLETDRLNMILSAIQIVVGIG
jgi:mRNA interferase MazF